MPLATYKLPPLGVGRPTYWVDYGKSEDEGASRGAAALEISRNVLRTLRGRLAAAALLFRLGRA